MGRPSRCKGARGECRWVRWFEDLGIRARRVGTLEPGRYGRTLGWDIELDEVNPVLKVQVKELAANCPSPRKLLAQSHIACVHFTSGDMETRDVVMMRADIFAELAGLARKGDT